ncbi:MAG TPA: hypothetical protein VM387_04265 [Gemmatimonadales bacterium]|nr:hypothetical protein [Gemmatimonadales bacterium]
MIPTRIWAAAALIALVGCGDKPAKPVAIEAALPNIPLPPSPTVVSRTGGANTAMITLRSPAKIADVEKYYRSVLTGPGWKLVKQSTDRSGAIILLAEQDGPPLWVRLRSIPDNGGTLVDLAGAVVDSASAKRAS